MRIEAGAVAVERHPLRHAVGFKGSRVSELWQSVVSLRGDHGAGGLGTGIQSVLWSDAEVFLRHGEEEANRLMLETTRAAVGLAAGLPWSSPAELLLRLLDPVRERARAIVGSDGLRETFVLNALVGVDIAAWQMHARAHGLASFDAMVPAEYRPALAFRHDRLAVIPLISYATSLDEVSALLREGHCLLKIKIGSDPAQDGDRERMLAWDRHRLTEIHRLAERFSSPWTTSGRILYYLDANGRYDSMDRVRALLAHARSIGALDRIAVLEEPFPEAERIAVGDLGVLVAADESAHGDRDVVDRIGLGYGAIALKPVAKTPSMSLRMLGAAFSRGAVSFCADLTVDPLLREWNKNVAARIAPLPGMRIGVVESNGAQNYAGWSAMVARHPRAGAPWLEPRSGVFHLDGEYFSTCGGTLVQAPAYRGPSSPW